MWAVLRIQLPIPVGTWQPGKGAHSRWLTARFVRFAQLFNKSRVLTRAPDFSSRPPATECSKIPGLDRRVWIYKTSHPAQGSRTGLYKLPRAQSLYRLPSPRAFQPFFFASQAQDLSPQLFPRNKWSEKPTMSLTAACQHSYHKSEDSKQTDKGSSY